MVTFYRSYKLSYSAVKCVFNTLLIVLFVQVSCTTEHKKEAISEAERILQETAAIRYESPEQALRMLLVCDSLTEGHDHIEGLRFDIKYELAFTKLELGKYDSARLFFNEAMKYQSSNRDLGHVHFGLGNIFGIQNFLDSSLVEYQTALKYFEESDLGTSIAKTKFNIANVLTEKGNMEMALQYYLEGLDHFKQEKDHRSVIIAYMNIGIHLRKMKNYEEAKHYYRKGINLAKAERIFILLPDLYQNMGVNYNEANQPDSAFIYFRRSISDSLSAVKPIILAKSYLNMGITYSLKGQLDSSKIYFEKSLSICEDNNIKRGELKNRINLAFLQVKKSAYDEAIQALRPLLSENITHEDKRDIYENLSLSYKRKGKFKQAFLYQEMCFNLQDSLLNESLQKQIIETERKYQTKIKDKEIIYLNELMKKNKFIGYATIGILLLIILLLLLTILWFRRRKAILRKEKQLEIYEKRMLETELEKQNRELASNLLYLSSVQNTVEQVKNELKTIIKNKPALKNNDFTTVFGYLDTHSDHNRWGEFYERFDEIHSDFLKKLTNLHPNLTASEIRICVLLKLNISTKDVCFLTSRSLRTIENIRYRMRKKMGLEKDLGLVQYILSI